MGRLLIDDLAIDGELRVVPTQTSEATEFPVESGADLTDHVRRLPLELEIEGIVTNTPIGGMVELRGATASADRSALHLPTPTELALAHFDRIVERRLPITIQTSTKLYEQMVMISNTEPRDATTGKAMRFTASFRQITIVTNQRTLVRTAAPRGSGVKNLGAKPAVSTDAVGRGRGPAIVWRKGTPPGGPGPQPFPVEVIYFERNAIPGQPSIFMHEDGKQLTDAEVDAFAKDATRDAEARAARDAANERNVNDLSRTVFKPDGSVDTQRSSPPRSPRAFRDS